MAMTALRCQSCGAPMPMDCTCVYCGTNHTVNDRVGECVAVQHGIRIGAANYSAMRAMLLRTAQPEHETMADRQKAALLCTMVRVIRQVVPRVHF